MFDMIGYGKGRVVRLMRPWTPGDDLVHDVHPLYCGVSRGAGFRHYHYHDRAPHRMEWAPSLRERLAWVLGLVQ